VKKIDVDIRELQVGDVALLEEQLKPDDESKFRRRYQEHAAGVIKFLIAWEDGRPIGHGYVRWHPGEPLSYRYPDVPSIGDLAVKEELRSRGVGSNLMDEAEELVGDAGRSLIAIGVDLQNERARSLYERRGYVDSGIKPYRSHWSYVDRRGRFTTRTERILYLIKTL
jgi:ribosomal protein S18 acetylase RimI-like enzyme